MNAYKIIDEQTAHIVDEEGRLISKIDNDPSFMEICKKYKWEHDNEGHVISRSPNNFGTDTIYLAQLVLNYYRDVPMYPQLKMG